MKARVFCVISLLGFVITMGMAPLTAQSESKDQLKKFYRNCIEKKISNCKAKTALKNSRSENLQMKANLAQKQLIFFTNNKNELIDEMIDQQIGYKQYKVEHYLNRRFYEMSQ